MDAKGLQISSWRLTLGVLLECFQSIPEIAVAGIRLFIHDFGSLQHRLGFLQLLLTIPIQLAMPQENRL